MWEEGKLDMTLNMCTLIATLERTRIRQRYAYGNNLHPCSDAPPHTHDTTLV